MEAMIGILGLVVEVGKCIGGPIKRHLNYLCCFSNNIESLRDEAQKLKDKNDELHMRVDAAEDNAEVIYPQVKTWLFSASQSKDIINGIENEVPKVQKGCLNLISRYLLSRKAKKTTEALKELSNNCKFDQISQDAPPAAMESLLLGPKEEFQTRKEIEEDVMEALRDRNVNNIGLCGMGGVGKTTMAERIVDRVKEEKLFDEALKVVVSQQVEMLKIQQSIASQLDLKLDGEDLATRAYKIRTRLTTTTKRILIVVDDVWDSLKLQDLGIPSANISKKCKILLTSRDKSVLNMMETQRIFEIKILPEREAWILFREKAGNCVDREELHSIAKDVAKECKGLPVALVTVGGALKNKERQELWEDALVQLRSSNPVHLPKVLASVYKPLKVSYDNLEDKDARFLFLLCSIFKEDDHIFPDILTGYGMGLNMFEGLGNLKEARNRTCALIELLKDRSLLLSVPSQYYVKMHDVVRDVAIYIASEEKRGGFVINFDRPSQENCYEDWLWISMTYLSNRTEFPVELKYPSLRILTMQSGNEQSYNEEMALPDNVFDGMQEIRVLSMEKIRIRSLPPTTQLLKNLKTLYLFNCPALESINVVGMLLKLEILCCSECDNIEALPTEIGRLNRLRLLTITQCRNLKRIVRGVISNLISLEELRILWSFDGWEAKESANTKENATLVELEPLTKLTCLEIDISNVSLVAEEICLPSHIVKHSIAIMKERNRYGSQRMMCLEIPGHEMNVGNWIKTLLRSTESLHLIGAGAVQFLNLVELDKLKSLTLESCSSVKSLVNITGVFPLLEYLCLKRLENLEEMIPTTMNNHNLHLTFPNLDFLLLRDLPRLLIVQETLDKIVAPGNLTALVLTRLKDDAIRCLLSSFSNLEYITIEEFNGIKNLMSPSIAGNLVRLRSLTVDSCEMMLEVIADDGDDEEVQAIGQISLFPRLETMELYSLPNLRSFYQWNHHNTSLELPSLSKVEIRNCPQMETFTQGSVSTPRLVYIDIDLKQIYQTKDINEALQLCRDKKENTMKLLLAATIYEDYLAILQQDQEVLHELKKTYHNPDSRKCCKSSLESS